MTTRASIAGHPLHAMLVALPIGLWVFSFVADLIFLKTGDPRWASTAYFTLAGGLIGALLAAVPGLVDLFGLSDPMTRKVGITHMTLNLAIVAVCAVNLWLRSQESHGFFPYVLSGGMIVALLFSGWLGGQLVHVLGVTQPGSQRGERP